MCSRPDRGEGRGRTRHGLARLRPIRQYIPGGLRERQARLEHGRTAGAGGLPHRPHSTHRIDAGHDRAGRAGEDEAECQDPQRRSRRHVRRDRSALRAGGRDHSRCGSRRVHVGAATARRLGLEADRPSQGRRYASPWREHGGGAGECVDRCLHAGVVDTVRSATAKCRSVHSSSVRFRATRRADEENQSMRP